MKPKASYLLLGLAPLVGLAQENQALELSLKRAVEIAISPEGNTRIQLAEETVKQAEARSAEALAALLPKVEGSISQQSQTSNLEAVGIRLDTPIPGFEFPTFVGPYNVFDVRARGTQSILDFSSIRRYQASRVGVRASRSDNAATEDQVAAQVAKAYLAALRAEADVETAKANGTLAEALLQLSRHLKAAGTGTGIEITRASVELSNQKQRLLVAENSRRRAHLELLRAMGLRLDTPLALTDKLMYTPVDAMTLEQAKTTAIESRADLKAQEEREESVRLSSSATNMERLPSLGAFGNYGSIGSSINNALPTRTYGVELHVPVFDGVRRARRQEAASLFRQERTRTRDLKEQVDLDVRLALDALRSADDQVRVAEEGLTLAENELTQARRRYEAGITNSLEVTDAQTRLERARDNRIVALFSHNQARIDLSEATGTIRNILR